MSIPQTEATTDGQSTGLAVTEGCARPRAHFVRMFRPRFAALVEAGTKTQTVRPTPKRMPQVGDTISLRAWTGAPYRSKQRVLREAEISAIHEVIISGGGIILGTDRMTWSPHLWSFARLDGFADWPEMREWFRGTHGLPFTGIVLYWHNKTDETRAP